MGGWVYITVENSEQQIASSILLMIVVVLTIVVIGTLGHWSCGPAYVAAHISVPQCGCVVYTLELIRGWIGSYTHGMHIYAAHTCECSAASTHVVHRSTFGLQYVCVCMSALEGSASRCTPALIPVAHARTHTRTQTQADTM